MVIFFSTVQHLSTIIWGEHRRLSPLTIIASLVYINADEFLSIKVFYNLCPAVCYF